MHDGVTDIQLFRILDEIFHVFERNPILYEGKILLLSKVQGALVILRTTQTSIEHISDDTLILHLNVLHRDTDNY